MIKAIFREYFLFCFSGVVLGAAFLFPHTLESLCLGWVAVIGLCHAVNVSKRLLSGLFVCGIVTNLVGFYWIPATIKYFGGFSFVMSAVLFALFCAGASLQFLLFGIVYKFLAKSLARGLAITLPIPVAWLAVESFVPRMFPWSLSHTMIIWTSFAGLAEIVGVPLLSALMLFWASLISFVFLGRLALSRGLVILIVASLLPLCWGVWRTGEVGNLLTNTAGLKAALIQGNLEAKQKGDVKYFDSNIERYRELSKLAAENGAGLILWPESVVNQWLPESVNVLRGTSYDPLPAVDLPLIYGGLSFAKRQQSEYETLLGSAYGNPDSKYVENLKYLRFNSSIGRDKDGGVVGKYHKRVLMPFGEYIPFARYFPWLQSLSPQTGDFDSGRISSPISLNIPLMGKLGNTDTGVVPIMPLVCYEDLISNLSRDGVMNGATVLVNLTNDAWYGDTLAPYQHNLLASWRAIETRRYLLRVTNTGYTSVVNPFGEIIADMPIFSSNYLIAEVKPLKIMTFYARFGELPSYLLMLAVLISVWWRQIVSRFFSMRNRTESV